MIVKEDFKTIKKHKKFKMAKTISASKAPRTQGFNRSVHCMNPKRKTENLKGVAKVKTKATI
ncbi:unnamed protein product [Aphis gossypii]|uniref:Uncharacterized protein n=1 Tax=Aphis gossypii TaxID=80765 RepID=A0A9P0NM66_APHGO|nr:unnamed protein product [Aphis gossypii]